MPFEPGRGPSMMRVGLEAEALLAELGIATPTPADRERALRAWLEAVCAVYLVRTLSAWSVREAGAVVASASDQDTAEAMLRERRYHHALERLRVPRGAT
jgi:hypothetical protein